MTTSGWSTTLLLLLSLSGSAGSPAPAFPPQMSPASPSIRPPPPPPPPLGGRPPARREQDRCLLVSPSALVVRFGDPVVVNCSVLQTGFLVLGWEVSLASPGATTESFLVWSVDRMTDWDVKPTCFAIFDQQEQCVLQLPVVVYKPPETVSISFVNHTGPVLEGRRYSLRCDVLDVAPVENLTVTFYKGTTALSTLRTRNCVATPVTEVFTLTITPHRDDDGARYWCQAELQLGPGGPLPPPLVTSEKITTAVLFGPQLVCPPKLRLREGERLSCEVRGNPPPLVTWYRNGQAVVLPAHSSREDAGKYTALARGTLELKNFTVEVEILGGYGSASGCRPHFSALVALVHVVNWM